MFPAFTGTMLALKISVVQTGIPLKADPYITYYVLFAYKISQN